MLNNWCPKLVVRDSKLTAWAKAEKSGRCRSLLRLITVTWVLAAAFGAAAQTADSLEQFDYVLGTQTFGPAYQFSPASPLVETGRAIAALGSNTIKFELKASDGRKHSLPDIARDDPAVSAVLAMPFTYTLMWAYPAAVKARLFDPAGSARSIGNFTI